MKSVLRCTCHGGYITNCMKLTRSIWQSCNILVGNVTDELNFKRNAKVDGGGRYVPALDLSPGFDDWGCMMADLCSINNGSYFLIILVDFDNFLRYVCPIVRC